MADKLIHFMMSLDLIQRIDDFRFAHRFESRAAAIRALIESALADAESVDAAKQESSTPFADYLAKRSD